MVNIQCQVCNKEPKWSLHWQGNVSTGKIAFTCAQCGTLSPLRFTIEFSNQQSTNIELFGALIKQLPDFATHTVITKCDHSWVPYAGFTDSYEYCLKCSKKRNS